MHVYGYRWSDEMIETVKKMWSEGLTATAIAKHLDCGLSRNAVIGKVYRLGLPLREPRQTTTHVPSVRQARQPRKPKAPVKQRPAIMRSYLKMAPIPQTEPVQITAFELFVPVAKRKGLVDAEAHDCRWLHGDGPYHLCDRRAVPGVPYCETHARRAYQPPQPRKRAPAPSLNARMVAAQMETADA